MTLRPEHLLWIAAAALVGCADDPTPPTPPAAVPPEPPPRMRDGFEGGGLAPFWRAGDEGSGRYAEGAIVVTDSRARSGRHSARITVREGDVAQVDESGERNERAELDSRRHPLLGQDTWCGFSFLVPREFPIVDVRLVLSQWKQTGLPGSPIVAQRFVGGRHYLTIRDLSTRGEWRQVVDLPDIVPEQWNDMVFHVRFATDASGLVEVWMNGRQVVNASGPTASVEGEPFHYHKVGLYRDRMAAPMTMFLDNYAMGRSFADVDPARFD